LASLEIELKLPRQEATTRRWRTEPPWASISRISEVEVECSLSEPLRGAGLVDVSIEERLESDDAVTDGRGGGQ
jgi:hypothetical protein